MNKSLIKKMKDTFDNLQELKPEQMEELMTETLKVFQELNDIAKSKDIKKQMEALEFAQEMKATLEDQALELSKTIGLDPKELAGFIQNAAHSPDPMKKLLETFEKDLGAFKPVLKTPQKTKATLSRIIG